MYSTMLTNLTVLAGSERRGAYLERCNRVMAELGIKR